MVYVRRGLQWAAYDLDDSQEIVADQRTPKGLTVIFGWHTSEGPGQGYAGLVFDRAGNA